MTARYSGKCSILDSSSNLQKISKPDQNTTISQQLALWDQKGSGVIRGKLIVIPIENSFLYVIPLYLKAEGTNFPQLKRVIVATGDKVVMEPTLDEALNSFVLTFGRHIVDADFWFRDTISGDSMIGSNSNDLN